MIVRTLYHERTHETRVTYSTTTAVFAGCTFTAPVTDVVRTRCDLFFEPDVTPIVVMADETKITCYECLETARIALVRARVAAG